MYAFHQFFCSDGSIEHGALINELLKGGK